MLLFLTFSYHLYFIPYFKFYCFLHPQMQKTTITTTVWITSVHSIKRNFPTRLKIKRSCKMQAFYMQLSHVMKLHLKLKNIAWRGWNFKNIWDSFYDLTTDAKWKPKCLHVNTSTNSIIAANYMVKQNSLYCCQNQVTFLVLKTCYSKTHTYKHTHTNTHKLSKSEYQRNFGFELTGSNIMLV
jgi:hypothetical protein